MDATRTDPQKKLPIQASAWTINEVMWLLDRPSHYLPSGRGPAKNSPSKSDLNGFGQFFLSQMIPKLTSDDTYRSNISLDPNHGPTSCAIQMTARK